MYHYRIQLVDCKVPDATDHEEQTESVHKRFTSEIHTVNDAKWNSIPVGNHCCVRQGVYIGVPHFFRSLDAKSELVPCVEAQQNILVL